MSAYLDTLTAKFAGAFATSAFRDNRRVIVSSEKAHEVLFALLKCLKEECGFDMLAELGGVDYLNYPDAARPLRRRLRAGEHDDRRAAVREDVRERAGPGAAVGLRLVEGRRLDGARSLRHVRHRVRRAIRTCAAS